MSVNAKSIVDRSVGRVSSSPRIELKVRTERFSANDAYKLTLLSIQPAESGEYWRLLIPGYYELVASKEGYGSKSRIISIEKTLDRKEIESKNPAVFEAEIVDFVLDSPGDELEDDTVFDDYVKY